MTIPKTIGFPRMLVEAGEKRVFLPDFMHRMVQLGLHVYLEEGYGSRLGYSFNDYQRGSENIHHCSRAEAFQQDLVLILRAPKRDEYPQLASNSVLIAMLHFPTRPARVAALQELGIRAISLDGIVDDFNVRRIENMPAVAWNGLEAAFDQLQVRWPGLTRPDGRLIQVLILGTGMVGKHAVEAATKLGIVERYNDHIAAGGAGAFALSVGRAITRQHEFMREFLEQTDILVDATQRRDPTQPVISNQQLAALPEHSIIVDLAVDPYLPEADPPVVRGIEGIPQGSLDQYVFQADDPNWCATIPAHIASDHRRTTVSCYSWPGVHPVASMEHYARQLMPMMSVLIAKGYDQLSMKGGFFERALYRGTIKSFVESVV
jgi:alanine dehydrogenase